MGVLELLVVVLLVLWLAGYAAFPVAGSAIHLLLVIALVVIAIRLLRGRL